MQLQALQPPLLSPKRVGSLRAVSTDHYNTTLPHLTHHLRSALPPPLSPSSSSSSTFARCSRRCWQQALGCSVSPIEAAASCLKEVAASAEGQRRAPAPRRSTPMSSIPNGGEPIGSGEKILAQVSACCLAPHAACNHSPVLPLPPPATQPPHNLCDDSNVRACSASAPTSSFSAGTIAFSYCCPLASSTFPRPTRRVAPAVTP
jgi:hypothetical protein